MKTIAVCCALALLATPAARADHHETKKDAQAPAEMPMPKPGPEHEMLKADVGTWDAKVEMFMEPGKPPVVSPGSETNMLGGGGMWLVSHFKSEMMGQPFEGHGTFGWDPAKKAYVSTWVDSMSTSISFGEATHDAKSKTLTGWMETVGSDGKPMKMKTVSKWNADGTRTFDMMMPGPGGKDITTMRITYTKRK